MPRFIRPFWEHAPYVLFSAAIGAAVLAVYLAGQRAPTADLLAFVPAQAAPGETIALRTLLFADLEAPKGPSLRATSVKVTLREKQGRARARSYLTASRVAGAEGVLRVPTDAHGQMRLRFEASVDSTAFVEAPLTIVASPSAANRISRAMSPLQAYRLGPILGAGASHGEALEPRIVGGTCAPELPCKVIVPVSSKVVRLAASSGAATVSPPHIDWPRPERQLAVLTVVPRRPEAVVRVSMDHLDGQKLERDLQLPISLHRAIVEASPRSVAIGTAVRVSIVNRTAASAFIVDGYRNGRWQRTGSLNARPFSDVRPSLPFADLEPGVWQLLVRSDPYGTETAAITTVLIHPPGEPAHVVARALAGIGNRAGQTRMTLEGLTARLHDPSQLENAFAYVVASEELKVYAQPLARSGYAQAGLAARRDQARVSRTALVVAVGSAIFLALGVARRGLRASAEAERVMDEADVGPAQRRSKLLAWATVMGFAVAVGLLALSAAMLIIARQGGC
jgi:hypothetical protein